MTTLLTVSIVLAPYFLSSFAVTQTETYSLTVKVENLRNSKGVVQFTLYNKDGSIPDELYKNYYRLEKSEILDGQSEITFKNLSEGKYAVNVLHDENTNGKIDKGLLFPKEGIGFSNYQSIGLRNRPNFYQASFEIKSNKTISVKVFYF